MIEFLGKTLYSHSILLTTQEWKLVSACIKLSKPVVTVLTGLTPCLPSAFLQQTLKASIQACLSSSFSAVMR